MRTTTARTPSRQTTAATVVSVRRWDTTAPRDDGGGDTQSTDQEREKKQHVPASAASGSTGTLLPSPKPPTLSRSLKELCWARHTHTRVEWMAKLLQDRT